MWAEGVRLWAAILFEKLLAFREIRFMGADHDYGQGIAVYLDLAGDRTHVQASSASLNRASAFFRLILFLHEVFCVVLGLLQQFLKI